MARQEINIGAAPGDGTGDPARTAFSKINDMTGELYTPPVAYTDELFLPGVVVSGTAALIVSAQAVNYTFIYANRPMTVTELHCEITSTTANALIKLVAYRCSPTGVIGVLVAESAWLDASVAGIKSLTGLSVTMAVGETLALGLQCNNYGSTARTYYGWPVGGSAVASNLGTSTIVRYRGSAPYTPGMSALDPGPQPDFKDYSNTGYRNVVIPKISFS